MVQRKQAQAATRRGAAKSSAKSIRTTRKLPAPNVSRETLDATPGRALLLLRAIGTSKPIAARMKAYGFTQADAQEGWDLLRAASGFDVDLSDGSDNNTGARAAIAELDAADETLFRVLNASLRRRVPAFAAKVLDGLGAGQGAAVVLAVSELLDRLDAAFAKPDADANLAQTILEQRGYGADERARLRALTEQAQAVPDVDPSSPSTRDEAEKELVEKLQALRLWYEEWSEIAHAALGRRDYLLRAGLATRRNPAEPVAPPPAPAPAPA